jgi:hypothetical protein
MHFSVILAKSRGQQKTLGLAPQKLRREAEG